MENIEKGNKRRNIEIAKNSSEDVLGRTRLHKLIDELSQTVIQEKKIAGDADVGSDLTIYIQQTAVCCR